MREGMGEGWRGRMTSSDGGEEGLEGGCKLWLVLRKRGSKAACADPRFIRELPNLLSSTNVIF